MTKEIRFKQKNPKVGDINGVLRIIGRKLYLKVNSFQYAGDLIKKYREAGCLVQESRNWIMIDMFHTHQEIILGGTVLNTEETEQELEDKLFNFYVLQYAKAGMEIEVIK